MILFVVVLFDTFELAQFVILYPLEFNNILSSSSAFLADTSPVRGPGHDSSL